MGLAASMSRARFGPKRDLAGCDQKRNNLVADRDPLWHYIGNQEVADMSDRIEKAIELNAPVERVWRALTDHGEFGEWFRVKLDGPFVPGEMSTGHITYPGYEH